MRSKEVYHKKKLEFFISKIRRLFFFYSNFKSFYWCSKSNKAHPISRNISTINRHMILSSHQKLFTFGWHMWRNDIRTFIWHFVYTNRFNTPTKSHIQWDSHYFVMWKQKLSHTLMFILNFITASVRLVIQKPSADTVDSNRFLFVCWFVYFIQLHIFIDSNSIVHS